MRSLISALFAVILCACADGNPNIIYDSERDSSDSDSDDSESDEAESDSAESESEAKPGTECDDGERACASGDRLLVCTEGIWALAATCTDDGAYCVDGECVEPEEPCESGDTRCTEDGLGAEQCRDKGVFDLYYDCTKSNIGECLCRDCCGRTLCGCWSEGEECHCD